MPPVTLFCGCLDLQFVSRVDIKYKRMNSSERVRIINSGSTTLPRPGFETLRPEGEYKVMQLVTPHEQSEATAGKLCLKLQWKY